MVKGDLRLCIITQKNKKQNSQIGILELVKATRSVMAADASTVTAELL